MIRVIVLTTFVGGCAVNVPGDRSDLPDIGFMVRARRELHWRRSSVPLSVYLGPRTTAAQRAAWGRTAGALGVVVGCRVFRRGIRLGAPLPDLRGIPDGVVGVRRGSDPRRASTEFRYSTRTGEIHAALVTLPDVPDDVLLHVTLHEQGHVLGLEHDVDRRSVMYPTYSRRRAGRARLTRGDVERLRWRYWR